MKKKKKAVGMVLIVMGVGLLIAALVFAFKIDMSYTPYFMLSSIFINSIGVGLVRSGKREGDKKND